MEPARDAGGGDATRLQTEARKRMKRSGPPGFAVPAAPAPGAFFGPAYLPMPAFVSGSATTQSARANGRSRGQISSSVSPS